MFTSFHQRRWLARLRRTGTALVASSVVLGGAALGALPAHAATTHLNVGQRAHFRFFDVTVVNTVMDPEYYGYVVKLKVCVNHLPPGSSHGKTRISWDPWTITTNHGSQHPSVQEDAPLPTFPRNNQSAGRFAVGECATGYLPFFSVKLNDTITSIDYRNSLGDKASWAPSKTRLTLGQTKTFKHFTVRVTHVASDPYWFGAKAKICVRSLPPGSHGGKTTVSCDPWSISTDQGVIPMTIAQEGSSPWMKIFPEMTRLRPGECASGWLPFAAHDDVEVHSIRYRNSLGNKITWVV